MEKSGVPGFFICAGGTSRARMFTFVFGAVRVLLIVWNYFFDIMLHNEMICDRIKTGREPPYKKDAVRVIQAVTGTKLQIEEEGGDVDMCKAIEDMKRDERREGKREGRREGRKEGRREGRKEGRREGLEETTVSNLRSLMKNMNLAVDQALTALDISEKEWEKYRSRI